jgi:hypothetical protein
MCPPPAFGGGGGGVKSSEDARRSSVLYICKYFVAFSNPKILPQVQSVDALIEKCQILDSAKKGNVKMLSSMFEFMFVCRDYKTDTDTKAFVSIPLNQNSRVGCSVAFSVSV